MSGRHRPLPQGAIGATFCSGIGAPEVAAPWIDWRFASEIEAFPRAVLMARLGYRPPGERNQGEPLLWGDMGEITPETFRAAGIPLPDVIVAGTPCQAFSVAGLRRGTADPRGALTLKFVEICHGVHDAAPDRPFCALWENVPGVLSQRDNAFGCLMGGIVGHDAPLSTPDGRSWPRAGMVAGPRARAAWRILDAQHFGVPQRRRRVFLVVSFGDGPDPASVLFERQGGGGNPAPGGDAPQAAAADAGQGAPRAGDESRALIANAEGALPGGKPFLTASNLSKGVNNQTPLIAFHGTQDPDPSGEVSHTLGRNQGQEVAVAYDTTQVTSRANRSNPQPGDPCHPLAAKAHPPLIAPAAYDLRGREGGSQLEGPHDTANLRAASGGSSRSYVAEPWAVRRLTPTECHRLQGFPDDHCRVDHRGAPAKDGPIYKALGNSMAVPVMRWILARLSAADPASVGVE